MKKILLLGATGTAGSAISKKLLSDTAYHITLFARHAGEHYSEDSRTTVINGDAGTPEDLKKAVQGQDVVYCAISGDALPKIAGNIVAAMSESSVKRLIFMGAVGIYNEIPDEIDGEDNLDHEPAQIPNRQAVDIIEASSLNYTVLRPGYLREGAEDDFVLSVKGEPAKGYVTTIPSLVKLALQLKVDSLNRILDDLYEKIEDAQTRLDEVNQKITMVEKSAMTKKSIFEMLEGFSKYYDVMSPEDKKALLQAMVSFIELYPEKRDDKHLIKTIHFTFPVTYDGESGALFVRTNEQQVKTVVLLSHKKPDGHINVKVEFGEGEGKVPLDNIAKRAEEYKPKERVTYKMIKEYIEAKYGFKVHTAYIAEVKRDLGLPMYDAPNAVEELKQPRKHPTAEKVEAIKDALKHFEVI